MLKKIDKLKKWLSEQVDKDVFMIIIIFVTILCLIAFGTFAIEFINSTKYVEVNATISDVRYSKSSLDKNSDDSYINFIDLDYTYDNIEYSNSLRVDSKEGKNIGDRIDIKINPDNPLQIKNTYSLKSKFTTGIIFLIFDFITIRLFKYKKKIDDD